MINNESDNGEPTNDVSEYMKLFIGQIPRDYDEATLKDFFEEFGPVHEVTIMRDPITHISKGKVDLYTPYEVFIRDDDDTSLYCVVFRLRFYYLRQ